jgi:hypothetical protein
MTSSKYKRELLRRKESVGGEFAINKQDKHGQIRLLPLKAIKNQSLNEVGDH